MLFLDTTPKKTAPLRLPCLVSTSVLLVLALGLLAASNLEAAPPRRERGYPLIRTFQPQLEDAEVQNFDLATDPRGLLFLANGSGILVYDGAFWRGVEVGPARAAFSVAVNRNGKVGVGGVDELGTLETDELGRLRFVSLLDRLPPGTGPLGQIGAIVPQGEGFLFMNGRTVFGWDGASKVEILAEVPDAPPYPHLAEVDGTIYLNTHEGLKWLRGSRFEPVPGGEVFRGRRVDQLWKAPAGLYVSVRREGLFLLRDGRVSPFAPEASAWAKKSRVFAGAELRDGRRALGSILGGVLLLGPGGEIDQVIDSSVGLPDDYVAGMAVDATGELWLALNAGLARLDVSSPLSVLDRRSGLGGSVYTAVRHQGELWVGTASGTFRSQPVENRPALSIGSQDQPLRLAPVPGLTEATWSFLSRGHELLVGTARGVMAVAPGRAPTTVPETDITVYALADSPGDPSRVWAGLDRGLGVLRQAGDGSWHLERVLEGIQSSVRQIVERPGVVWCGTDADGIVGVVLPLPPVGGPPPAMVRLGGQEGCYLFRVHNQLLAVQRGRLRRLDEHSRSLLEDPALAFQENLGLFTHVAEDASGNLWLNTRPPTMVQRQGEGWSRSLTALAAYPATQSEPVLTDPDGAVWLAAETGLYRHGGAAQVDRLPLPAPLVASVASGRDRVLGAASFAASPPPLTFAAGEGRLRIRFAPHTFVPGLRFSTRLDPIDEEWSAPQAEPFTELTRLPPGSYTFHLRTLGPGAEVSPTSSWSFRVLPPWYRTPWALLAWVALALALLRAYGRLRSRALRQRAALLEARVQEQTAELSHTVAELSRTKGDLEAANAWLAELAERDDLTGLANRRRLRPSLAAEWARAAREGRPLAFVLIDLDHFKELNDTLGHAEGDRCLAAVASTLAARLRRSGDLLVRYGGEEFALLLPDTDLQGAFTLAEELRHGLEALALPHPTARGGRITASFGVAAEVPGPSASPEDLITAADQALYQAKKAGRNRVEGLHFAQRAE